MRPNGLVGKHGRRACLGGSEIYRLIKPVAVAMVASAMLIAGAGEAKANPQAKKEAAGISSEEEDGGISALLVLLAGSAGGVYLVNRRKAGKPKRIKQAKPKTKNSLKKKQKVAKPSDGPAAGWYPDSQDSDKLRYFDGKKWGTQTYSRARAEKMIEEEKEEAKPKRSMEPA